MFSKAKGFVLKPRTRHLAFCSDRWNLEFLHPKPLYWTEAERVNHLSRTND